MIKKLVVITLVLCANYALGQNDNSLIIASNKSANSTSQTSKSFLGTIDLEEPIHSVMSDDNESKLYYAKSNGLIYVTGYVRKKKENEGYLIIVDPLSRKVLERRKMPIEFNFLSSYESAISPDGKYLISKRNADTGGKNYYVFNLDTGTILFEEKREINIYGLKNGMGFINNTDYFMVEGEMKSTPGADYQNLYLVTRRLPSNEVINRWKIPNLEHFEIKTKGQGWGSSRGVSSLAYHPISPWGVPIIIIQNFYNFYVFDFNSKKLLVSHRPHADKATSYNGYSLVKFESNSKIPPPGSYQRQSALSIRFNYLIIATNFTTEVRDLKTLELVWSKRYGKYVGMDDIYSGSKFDLISEVSESVFRISRSPEDLKLWKEATLVLEEYELPEPIQEEIRYMNWLKSCDATKDSLAELSSTIAVKYKMNSPDNDWVYIGDEGKDGLANGLGHAIRKDGLRYIENGVFYEGEFVYGKVENVYGVTMEGEFKNMKLNGYGRSKTENKTILEGEFVDGKLEGIGESIDPSGLQYVGAFKNGVFEGNGKITRPDGEKYEGEFRAGKPHGTGIYKDGNVIERCEYYEGQRIDQAYQMKIQADRLERERKLAELQEQQRAEYLEQQRKKKSSNKLIGALVMGTGFGIYGSSVGMDALQAVEIGSAMFQDVLNGGTSNIDAFKSGMMAEFEAKRQSYESFDREYANKYYSSFNTENDSNSEYRFGNNRRSQEEIDNIKAQRQQEWQERQQRIAENKMRLAELKALEIKQAKENCLAKDPECRTCGCQSLLKCNQGSAICSR